MKVIAADGVGLSVERWLPEDSPTAIVHIIHGMAEHAARYARLAEVFTDRGWEVWADDHRGHGRTAGSIDAAGSFASDNGWEVVLGDQRLVLDTERAMHPDLPVVVLGHSLGSIIARDLAIRWGDEFAALVLTGAPGDPGIIGYLGQVLASRESAKESTAPSPRLNSLSFGGYNKAFRPNRSEFDWLSRDHAEVDAYLADPMCGFICSAGLFRDMLTGLSRVTDPDLLANLPAELPVLVETGSADPVTRNGRSSREIAAALTKAGVREVTCVSYQAARHEIFNEINRAAVSQLTADWIAAQLTS